MDEKQEAFQRVCKFYNDGQYQLALDKLREFAAVYADELDRGNIRDIYQAKAVCLHGLGDVMGAIASIEQAIAHDVYLYQQQMDYSSYLFFSHYIDGLSDQALRDRHLLFNRFFEGVQQYSHQPQKKQKLRIGYISPDFREHIMAYFLIQLLACHDGQRYEVICYDLSGEKDDPITVQMKGLVEGWRDISRQVPELAAKTIHDDKVDILMDLAAHTGNGQGLRILAHKPAPVQLSGIGYMSTTGLKAVDYFLTDIYCDPPGQQDEDFIENLIRLPHSHFCYTPSECVLSCKQEYVLHMPVVFGSFNNFNKITDRMLGLWLQIVQQVPGSRLLLKNPKINQFHKEREVQRRARKIGFTAEQLEIRSWSREYLPEYMDMDIALDTFPYTGGGTTCEALYMGVPVITLTGTRHGTRFGYSLIENIGIGELAAANEAEYVKKAVSLAEDKELLIALHRNLQGMMKASPVMDGAGYTREVEAAYETIWRKWLMGNKKGR